MLVFVLKWEMVFQMRLPCGGSDEEYAFFLRFRLAGQYKTTHDFNWINDIVYVDSENRNTPSPSAAAWKRSEMS